MNYIFFDIECANCQKGEAKICSFGYVVADEEFNVLEKEDWIINPRAPFMLMGHGNRPYIKLAYTKDEFKAAPTFPWVYERIRDLLRRPDSLVFGYAADNDASYLKCEFLRYNLRCVNFTYYDLQKMLHFALPEAGQNQISLSSAAALFVEEAEQEVHKSDDDALLTMYVLKGISEKLGHAPIKLLELFPVCRGDLVDNSVRVRTLEGQNLIVRILGDKTDRIAPKSENRTIYTRFIRHVKPSGGVYPQWLKGKRVSIPEKYAERHYRDALRLIQLVCDCGGRYHVVPDESHVYISFPVYNDDGSLKNDAQLTKILAKRPNSRVRVLTPEQFFAQCGLSAEQFAELPLPEVRYLLDERYAPQQHQPRQSDRPQRRTPPVKERDFLTIIPSRDEKEK